MRAVRLCIKAWPEKYFSPPSSLPREKSEEKTRVWLTNNIFAANNSLLHPGIQDVDIRGGGKEGGEGRGWRGGMGDGKCSEI